MGRRNIPLDRQRILQTAIELADQNGLERLTMRRLASVLGVEAMSLYHHFASKDALLDGMVDLVFQEIEAPVPGDEWHNSMRQRAHSVKAAFTRHRWALGLVESRTNPGPPALKHYDAMLGTLRVAGFSVVQAAQAYALLDSYIYGFVLQELSIPFKSGEEVAVVAKSIADRLSPADYPYLLEFAREHVMRPGYDFGDEFERGLDLILTVLERLVRH